MKYLTTLFILLLSSITIVSGQDIKGGEMSLTHVSGLTYQINIFLYTQTSSGISHSNILVNMGDSSIWTTIAGTSTIINNDVTRWHYTSIHTYPGSSSTGYIIEATDSFRLVNIQNINNSSTESIHLKSTFLINPFIGINSTPILFNDQLQVSSNGGNFIHNPGPIDIDGDSLFFSLAPTTSSNYTTPAGATIDSSTGIFQMPIASGTYAINIKIQEYRSGTNISTTYREMVIDSSMIVGLVNFPTNQSQLKVYPNPTNKILNIENKNGLASIALYNMEGREIMYLMNLKKEKIKITIEHLPSGIYTLKTINNIGEIQTKRIIKE